MKPKPLDLKELNKIADKIIEIFCVVDDIPYPNGTGIWGKDTEIYSTDKNETARSKARKDIIREIKQRIRKACEFYLEYKDNPDEFEAEQEKLIKKENIEIYYNPEIVLDKNGKIIPYNEWLFKLAFRSVLK